MSPILFFIYISSVFNIVSAIFLQIIFYNFVNDLRFWVSGNLIQKVAISLKKTREAIFGWELFNAVTYDVTKTEAILFFRARSKKIKEEII